MNKIKRTILVCFVVVLCLLAGCSCKHEWNKELCSEPSTCALCGAQKNDQSSHRFGIATCETPRTCYECSATEGEPKGHNWRYSSEVIGRRCINCEKVEEYTTLGLYDTLALGELSFTVTDVDIDTRFNVGDMHYWSFVTNDHLVLMLCEVTNNSDEIQTLKCNALSVVYDACDYEFHVGFSSDEHADIYKHGGTEFKTETYIEPLSTEYFLLAFFVPKETETSNSILWLNVSPVESETNHIATVFDLRKIMQTESSN